MKSEPDVFSIDDLKRDGKTSWTGVRNYQARNFMRDRMTVGDMVLFYHSSTDPSGVVGLGKVCSGPKPDPTAWDPKSPYFDPATSREKPVWMMVDIAYVKTFPRVVTLAELRTDRSLQGMLLLQKGSRLSVQPVDARHYEHICALAMRR